MINKVVLKKTKSTPPNPRGPGASEPPAGLGAAKLERPTCPAPPLPVKKKKRL